MRQLIFRAFQASLTIFIRAVMACTAIIATGTLVVASTSDASTSRTVITPDLYSGLNWRLIGPFRGGRVLTVAGVPGNPALFYFGSVDDGVWKTTDAGRTWSPIFDRQPVGSIGAIAIAPSNPNTLYVGSGEADMRSDISYGNGMYKSIDAGHTWRHIGLTDTRQIARIVVDPSNTSRLFVAALGHAYGANAERGVFRSLDGGTTWQKVLFVDNDTGAVDLAMDSSNPKHLLAAMWQTRRPPWDIYQPSNGPGSGLYASPDGGTTWRHLLGRGPPAEKLGRMGIAFAPSNSKRIYVIVDAKRGGLYRSDDGGGSWRLVNADPRLWDRGWYFCKVTVDPKNSDIVYVSNTAFYRSTNGGKSFTAIKGSPDGDDFHWLWIDPTAPNRLILASDQGASISLNSGATWSSWYNQPTGQFYHVITDSRFPFSLYGAQQDSGAAMALSRSAYNSLTFRDWRAVTVGGESDMLAPDLQDSNIVFGGRVDRYDVRTSQDQIVDPTLSKPQVQWRDNWTLPLVLSPADRRSLYFGRQMLFRSTDAGHTWKVVSPDLSWPNPGVPHNLDAATVADNQGTGRRRGVICTIAPSPLRAAQVWVGTDDGKVWLTFDGGAHWRDVTPPQLTPWSKVAMLDASRFAANDAYVAVDRHTLDDLQPYIYRTRDGGATWQLASSGIPDGSYVNAVRADPQRHGLLYAGTETGPYVSFDDGDRWLPLQLNLPNVSIRDFSVNGDSLAIATHGRGLWVLDDLSPLRQLDGAVAGSDAWLFAPATTVRVRPGDDQAERLPPDEPAAPNPPSGAIISYKLATKPHGPLTLEIIDLRGQIARQWSSKERREAPNPSHFPYIPLYIDKIQLPPVSTGLHQFVWDLHYAALSGLPKNGELGAQPPWAPPGQYIVRMSVDDRVFERPLEVVKDPRVTATDADLRAQFVLAARIEQTRERAIMAYHRVGSTIGRLHRLRQRRRTTCTAGDAAAASFQLSDIAGAPAPIDPDNSMGFPEHNLASLHYLSGRLALLETAVESADAAPTPDQSRAFTVIGGMLAAVLQRLPKTVCGIPVN